MYESTKSRQQLMIETGIGLVKNEFITRPEECQRLNRSSRLRCSALRHKIERETRSNSGQSLRSEITSLITYQTGMKNESLRPYYV